MSESKDNVITYGMSGLFGNLVVFRSRLGRTFAGKRPKSSSVPPTEEQAAQRKKFADGVIYGKAAISDPTVKEMYAAMAKPFQSAFNVATIDFASGPEIRETITTGYNGNKGSKITAKVIDNCKVDRVHVSIKTGAGALVEEGYAVAHVNGLDWEYTATKDNVSITGCVISVTAYDLPGNSTSIGKTL